MPQESKSESSTVAQARSKSLVPFLAHAKKILKTSQSKTQMPEIPKAPTSSKNGTSKTKKKKKKKDKSSKDSHVTSTDRNSDRKTDITDRASLERKSIDTISFKDTSSN